MLRTIRKLLGEKSNQIKFPIALMGADAVLSIVLYVGVIEEDVQYIRVLLRQTSVKNKEISVQIKATVENDSQMYKLKLHTLWSPMKKDV